MKRLMKCLVGIFLLASCSQVESIEDTKLMTFEVGGEFVKIYEGMSRATVTDAGMTDIWVFDYVGGVLKQQVHQQSTATDFGKIQMPMIYGGHSVKFIASKGDTPMLSASTLSWSKVKDTFILDYPVTVAPSDNGVRTPQLQRAVSAVKLVFTDDVPATAAKILITFYRSMSLNTSTLTAGTAESRTTEYEIPTSWVGRNNGDITAYTLCPAEEMTTDIAVEVMDGSGSSISSFVVKDVSLKKNRITTLKGEVFSRSNGFSVTVNNSWSDGLEITF